MSVTENSIVGVLADVRREAEGDFTCSRTCVFGLSREEFEHLQRSSAAKIEPSGFSAATDRYVVHCNPWRVMRLLGGFGYGLPVGPTHASAKLAKGVDKRTCIWTLQRTTTVASKSLSSVVQNGNGYLE